MNNVIVFGPSFVFTRWC